MKAEKNSNVMGSQISPISLRQTFWEHSINPITGHRIHRFECSTSERDKAIKRNKTQKDYFVRIDN